MSESATVGSYVKSMFKFLKTGQINLSVCIYTFYRPTSKF